MENPARDIINNYPRLSVSDTFSFACKKDLPCFNRCCADINIVLTPYDIIRLKTRLNISSDEFLKKYCVIPFNKQQKIPVVILKMEKGGSKSCSFVEKEGCTVYEDRPWACRMYPLGLASPAESETSGEEEFYFLMQEDVCHGVKEKRELTVGDWIKEQGIDEYFETGEWFTALTMHEAMLAGKELNPGQMEMFYLVCYNIDKFRRFVFESSFLESFEVDEDTIAKIKDDDIELLKFGFRWLRYSLFKEDTIRIKNDVLEAKKKKMKGTKANDEA